jgi:putative transcriptional regulator
MPDRPTDVGAEELTKLRLKNGMSQSVFVQVLNVSTKTVQSWEQGQRKPSQAALRLLQVFRQNPSGLLELVGMSARNHRSHR